MFRIISKRRVEERQARMKDRYDDHAQQVEYQVGDTVWIYVPAFTNGSFSKTHEILDRPFPTCGTNGSSKFSDKKFRK